VRELYWEEKKRDCSLLAWMTRKDQFYLMDDWSSFSVVQLLQLPFHFRESNSDNFSAADLDTVEE
jgi:hypothetical protein